MNLLALILISHMWFWQVDQPRYLPTKSNQIQVLIQLAQSKNFWVSVHAIEFLAKLGFKKEAKSLAMTQLKPFEETPEKRIGYWRAQFFASNKINQRNIWVKKIKKAYLTSSSPDRIHAAESLAKIGISFKNLNPKVVRQDLNSQGMIYSFTRWGYSLGNHPRELPDYKALLKEISSLEKPQNRTLAAYALGYLLPKMNTATWKAFASSALKEDSNSDTYAFLIGGAYVHYNKSKHHADNLFHEIRKRILQFEYSSKKSEKIELCMALAKSASAEDQMIIERILLSFKPINLDSNSQDSLDADKLDIIAAAAYSWLQMTDSKNKRTD